MPAGGSKGTSASPPMPITFSVLQSVIRANWRPTWVVMKPWVIPFSLK